MGLCCCLEAVSFLQIQQTVKREDEIRYGLFGGLTVSIKAIWESSCVQNCGLEINTNGDTFEELAKKSTGIERLGILRADVDNMGHAFVAGFNDGKEDTNTQQYPVRRHFPPAFTFFKLQINKILKPCILY